MMTKYYSALAFFCVVALNLAFMGQSLGDDRVEIDRASFASEIGDRTVAFMAHDLETGTEYVLTDSDLATRHTPWSSFKIPNLLIALETGVAPTIEAHRKWDQVRRPPASFWPGAWRQDQTLRSAFQRSAVWYFQDIAIDVGAAQYRQILADWGYGVLDIGEGADSFWLNGELEVSVAEQAAFLRRLLAGDLKVDTSSIAALERVSLVIDDVQLSLHGKTGSGPLIPGNFDGAFEGWYSGFVGRADARPVVFSLYVTAKSFQELRDFRQAFAVRLLESAKILPVGFGQ